MRGPALLLGALLPAGLVVAGCIAPPDDATQIRRLLRDEAAARARGDRAALHRMHDPDFRAVCPLSRFPAVAGETEAPPAVDAIEVRGSRGWATVTRGDERERRALVKDAGRWYLYEDARTCDHRDACGVRGAACEFPDRVTHGRQRQARRTPHAAPRAHDD